MTKEEELYHEEEIQNLKAINKHLKGSAIIPIPELPEEIKANIVNKISAEITNKINIDEKPFEALSADFKTELELATTQIVKAVIDSVKEPLSEISVKNIKEAQAKSVTISNFNELKNHITDLTKVILANQPEINIEKQTIDLPSSARNPIAVRLSDGKAFYNAIATLASGGLSKTAQSNLEKLTFDNDNKLQVTGTGGGTASEVIIKDAGGEQVTVTGGKLDVNASVSTAGLATDTNQTNGSQKTQIVDSGGEAATVTGGKLDVNATVALDIAQPAIDLFGSAIGGSRYNQVEIDFSTTDPDAITDLTVTKTSTGDASTSGGQATFTSGANTSGGVKAVTNTSVKYRPHAESYAAFTAIFSAGLANSHQRIGIYDTNNGFFIGYEGTSFGVTKRTGAVDTSTTQASFSEDTLTGQAGTGFTRDGVAEAADFTKDNLFRIRYGWLGAASIYFEIFSPDGEWVTFHIIRYPNSAAVPTVQNPNLPITLDIQKSTAGATVLTMKTACWAGGTTSNFQKITDTITNNTLATLNRAVITGYSSAGGGSYNNVKVNPSGSLETNATVQGDVASAATDSGNPVKIGAKYNSTQPTVTDGQRVDLQATTRGALKVTLFANDTATTIQANPDNADAQATTATANRLTTLTRNTVFNGSTWDRQYGDATNGTWVNVKAGTVTASQATASNLKAEVSNAGTFATQATTSTATGDTTLQNAVSATGNGSSLTVTGYGVAVLQVSGTFTATITFEGSTDAGTTWTAISATQIGAADISTTTTTTGLYRISCTGLDLIRARVTWTSGTSVTVVGRATNAILSNKVIKLASGTNLVGKVSSSNETSTMYDGTTALTPKFAAISAASSGNNTLIAAVASKKIRVLALNLISAAANNIYITSGAGGTAIWAGSTNKANFAANGGMVLPYNPVGWFETLATNTALVANLSAASAIGGSITYVEV